MSDEGPSEVLRQIQGFLDQQSEPGVVAEASRLRRREHGHDPLLRENRRQDIRFKRHFGPWLLGLMIFQVAFVDLFLVLYAQWGVDWEVPPEVLQTWLGATVVQLIGVVYAITRYLYSHWPD
jgi:hypothetical protein